MDSLHTYLKLTGNSEDASDILQESYARMLEKYHDSPVKALLYRTGYNLFIDSKRKARHTSDSDEQLNYLSSSESTQDNMLLQERYSAVMRMMEKLSESERNLISLVTSGELSYREIGQITGLSEDNVKVKVHRIRKKLKKMMKKEGLL